LKQNINLLSISSILCVATKIEALVASTTNNGLKVELRTWFNLNQQSIVEV